MKEKIIKVLNSPKLLITVLCVICAVLLIYGYKTKQNESIYLGSVESDKINVSNIHLFSNNKINYFYATSAEYGGEEMDVYDYEVGYYIKKNNGEYVSFLSKKNSVTESVKLSDVITDFSGWNLGELKSSESYYFTKEIKNNLNNIYFIVKASTVSGGAYDVNIEVKANLVRY